MRICRALRAAGVVGVVLLGPIGVASASTGVAAHTVYPTSRRLSVVPAVEGVTSVAVVRLPVDRLRALLYRIDGEANVARLHPELAVSHAQAAARFARDAAAQMQGLPSLGRAGVELSQAAEALSQAARRRESEDVQATAKVVQERVRRLDEQIPAPQPAR